MYTHKRVVIIIQMINDDTSLLHACVHVLSDIYRGVLYPKLMSYRLGPDRRGPIVTQMININMPIGIGIDNNVHAFDVHGWGGSVTQIHFTSFRVA